VTTIANLVFEIYRSAAVKQHLNTSKMAAHTSVM